MDILSALKETGKARSSLTGSQFYIGYDKDDHIKWLRKKDDTVFDELSRGNFESNDWSPYHPTPEKCEACKEADRIERSMALDEFGETWRLIMPTHLRNDHCTCKKEKP